MKITSKQWSMINNILLRIHSIENADEMRKEFLIILQAIMQFDRAVFYISKNGNLYSEPVTFNLTDSEIRHYLENYHSLDPYKPFMSILIESHHPIRSSDYSVQIDIEKTDYYKYVWAPNNIRYSMFAPLSYNGECIGNVFLFRTKDNGDFTDEELEIMTVIKEHLQVRLGKCCECIVHPAESGPVMMVQENTTLKDAVKEFSLTAREGEIVELCSKGYIDSEICEMLSISKNTLKKHVSNIYSKMGITNRIELLKIVH